MKIGAALSGGPLPVSDSEFYSLHDSIGDSGQTGHFGQIFKLLFGKSNKNPEIQLNSPRLFGMKKAVKP